MVIGLIGCAGVAYAADPPAGMALWLKADTGVIEAAGVVESWQDQSGNDNDANRAVGTMQLATHTFNTGELPVIHFNQDGDLKLIDPNDLFLPDLTIYAVLEQTADSSRRSYFSTYTNLVQWGYGYHCDFDGSYTRVFTSAGTEATISDWGIGVPPLTAGYYYMTVAISDTAGSKSLYANGMLRGATTFPDMTFELISGCSIGALGNTGGFFFKGDIAEIIVYPSVDSVQQAAVESYLSEKYGIEKMLPKCGDWGYSSSDFNQDCYVNFQDFAVFAMNWMKCTLPDDAGGVDCVDLTP